MKHFQARSAFTLVELIIVLAVLSILTAVAFPHYAQNLARYRVRSAALRIAGDIALTAETALTSSSTRTITFDTTTHAYQIGGLADLDRAGSAWRVQLTEPPYRCIVVSADLGGDNSLRFNGHGIPDSGGTIVLRSGSASITILIDSATGRATLK